jgi:TRAP-type C4-dicarboxylate transport system permease small subunit
VKPNTLTIASLLSIILLPFHVGGDIAFGFDRGGSGLAFVLVPILLVVACGTLLLAERISGHILMFLGGLAALGMPIIHRNNGFTATVAKSPGGLFFIWTLVALGVTGGLAIILSARGLWNLRRGKPDAHADVGKRPSIADALS